MALFKRNDNKDQAAEDLAEGQAQDTSQDALGANAEDAPGEDSVPEQASASRKRFGKPSRKPKPKRNLRGVVRIEELEQALADQDLDDIDPDAVVSMYMPKRRMERIGAALLRMDKLQRPSWCWRLSLACCSPCRLCRKTWVTSPSTSTAWSCSAAAWPLPTTATLTTPPRAWPPTP
ncbi:MAG: hypothetical protein UI917_08915 [Collinsella sp.]